MRLGGFAYRALVALTLSAASARPAGLPGSVAEVEGPLASEVLVHAYKRTRRGMECVVVHPDSASHAAGRPAVAMHEIYSDDTGRAAGGLTITLVGTDQLEQTPDAKAAFIRAAQTWQRLLATPMTVVIGVDFGATDFGEPYDANVIGETRNPLFVARAGYPTIRAALLDRGEDALDRDLYRANVVAPAATFQALGLLPQQLDPADDGPMIGFNAAFSFDFDETNGTDSNKVDFYSVALHEIGHALGFISFVAERRGRDFPSVAILDLFRVGPKVTLETFDTAKRRLKPKGKHVFFDGVDNLALSTGKPNGKKGDRRQASHWKDDELTGAYIGIMDPTISLGETKTITDHDLRALDVMGYRLVGEPAP